MLQVRCLSATGEQLGIISTSDAMRMAEASGMDLVEISPTAKPPVCRIMNFGKYRYEESCKEKLARKHQTSTVVKEIKFHVNVDEHDYQTKLNHITGFLKHNHRVKTTLLFRGRENEHRELGYNLFTRLIKDCEDAGAPESGPRMYGRNLVMLMHPHHITKTGSTPSTPAKPPAPAPRPTSAPGATP